MEWPFATNVKEDFPDHRDWIYRPALTTLAPTLASQADLNIRDQGSEGACTGFALAAAIDIQQRLAGDPTFKCSARMLYEMAKRHDEWAGEDYSGSSLRGAIHGWKNMGVCLEEEWKYYKSHRSNDGFTVERAKAARRHTIGAYYRVRPRIADFHAALNEVGVLVASARVHPGWLSVEGGVIEHQPLTEDSGGHAFAVVGYNDKGFIVQNSWAKSWGDNGTAVWTYKDWIENVMDAWVFRMALPTPEIFGMQPGHAKIPVDSEAKKTEFFWKPTVKRKDIAGHFLHVDDGEFAKVDRYWSDANDVMQTVKLLGQSEGKYKHVLIYAHGGLNAPEDSARRIAAMKETFKGNGIYPYHIMYDTGLAEELKDLIFRRDARSELRTSGIADRADDVVEYLTRRPGKLIWREMKNDANRAFDAKAPGTFALTQFLEMIRARPAGDRMQLHLAGHSTGAVLIGHLLSALMRYKANVSSVSLFAPACTTDFYNQHYGPVLDSSGRLKVEALDIYNLKDKLERNDKVGSKLLYRKSLLYLVSRAFEENIPSPLLGMEAHRKEMGSFPIKPSYYLSNGVSGNFTRANSHGGFDNDPYTMNSLLRRILGGEPSVRFDESSLDYS